MEAQAHKQAPRHKCTHAGRVCFPHHKSFVFFPVSRRWSSETPENVGKTACSKHKQVAHYTFMNWWCPNRLIQSITAMNVTEMMAEPRHDVLIKDEYVFSASGMEYLINLQLTLHPFDSSAPSLLHM